MSVESSVSRLQGGIPVSQETLVSSAKPQPSTSQGGSLIQQIESMIKSLSDKDFRALVACKLIQSLGDGSQQGEVTPNPQRKRKHASRESVQQ